MKKTNPTFSQSLKTKSKSFQNKILGKEKAKLFRDGKFTFDKINGNVCSLKELKEMLNK